jgi:hypothetical protein
VTWIKTVPLPEASGELKRCYEAVYALYPAEYQQDVSSLVREDGTVDSIVAAHSLFPEIMRHALSAFGLLLASNLPLTRRQQEMICTVVSAQNRCFY